MRCNIHEQLLVLDLLLLDLLAVAVVVDRQLLQRLLLDLLLLDLPHQHQHPLCREDHNCVLHQWVLVDLPDLMGFAPCCK